MALLWADERMGAMANCWQYAIRPSIRNHNTLHRSEVIKQTASLVADAHKVDLTKPDKVIIVDVFQVRSPRCSGASSSSGPRKRVFAGGATLHFPE